MARKTPKQVDETAAAQDSPAIAMEQSPSLPTVTITVPIAEPVDGYIPSHIDCHLRERRLAVAFDRLYRGLDAAGTRLSDGRRIAHRTDALRWLCEQVIERILSEERL